MTALPAQSHNTTTPSGVGHGNIRKGWKRRGNTFLEYFPHADLTWMSSNTHLKTLRQSEV